jgi:tartrate dehydrogenase/decarboxylase/D-malate dehydrogenase
MMLEHLGESESATLLMKAIERVTAEGRCLPRDLGGRATTQEVTTEVCAALSS